MFSHNDDDQGDGDDVMSYTERSCIALKDIMIRDDDDDGGEVGDGDDDDDVM